MIVRLSSRSGSAYAVPREFSASEGEVILSGFLRQQLGLAEGEEGVELAVEAAVLPRGERIRLRPLEAGYDDEDWRAILERHVRERFATVVEGMIMEVGGKWRFLVDRAEPGGAVCVVDTDLEVEIEALSEEQARETLKRRLERKREGGKVSVEGVVEGMVKAGEEHFYELGQWERGRALEVRLEADEVGVDLFVVTDRQHHKPRIDEHVWGDMGITSPKRVLISPGNIELEGAKVLHIGVRGWKDPRSSEDEDSEPRSYTLRVTQNDTSSTSDSAETVSDEPPSPEHKRCSNCTQWVPSRTFIMHESFCLRNNVTCPLCKAVFKRGTETSHWHCADCSAYGNTPASHAKHVATTHTPHTCPDCAYTATSLRDLAAHRTSTCPAKLILCPFCHLLVPQEGSEVPDAEQILTGLTAHELQCGGRTTECDICNRRTRLRDMALHLKNHELTRLTRPLPTVCRNPLCTRKPENNPLALCGVCFGPLFASIHDPTGAALRSRVERKLLRQMLVGCGKSWCRSTLCKSGRQNLGLPPTQGTKEAMPLVKEHGEALPLCVDEATARRRDLAEALEMESVVSGAESGKGGYAMEFCCRAAEEGRGDLDKARLWLEREAVRSGERW
jgi:hypothetical protein